MTISETENNILTTYDSKQLLRIHVRDKNGKNLDLICNCPEFLDFEYNTDIPRVRIILPIDFTEILKKSELDLDNILCFSWTWTEDPYCGTKALIINLGYSIIRSRYNYGRIISSDPLIFETNNLADGVFKISSPPKYPTIKVSNSNRKLDFFGVAIEGLTNYRFYFEHSNTQIFTINFGSYFPKLKKGFFGTYHVDLHSCVNNILIKKETSVETLEEYKNLYISSHP
jgi:hypothetical protein